MTLLAPAGLWLLLLGLPVIALHLLRPRRQARDVSSTFLWREMAAPVSAAKPWQRIPPTLLLLLQLLLVLLLALAVARPARLTPAQLAPHTVFIVDASGSMAALDGNPDRLAVAQDRVRELRAQLPVGGLASLVVASDQPRVLLSASADGQAFEDALGTIRTTAGAADFAGAFTLASSLETPGAPIGFALFSDGELSDVDKRFLPAGTQFVPVGEQATNRAVSRLSVEPRGSGLHARVTLRNTGGPAATQTLRLDVDGRTAHTAEVTLGPGETKEVEADLPPGDRVQANLDGEDLLDADNRAYAVSARRRDLKVLLAGPDDPFLTELLAVTPGVVVERSAESKPAAGYDLAIYDQVAVPAEPGAPFVAIAPPGGAPGVTLQGTVETPSIALVRTDDDLLEGLDLSDIAVREAQRIDAPKGETLVGAEGAPLLVRGLAGDRPFVYLAFPLAESNLPVNVAFPILTDRLVTQLAGSSLPPADLVVGRALPVDSGVASTLVDPIGRETALTPGRTAPIATRPGFWTIRVEGRPDRLVAVNVAAAESDLAPVRELPIPVREAAEGEQVPEGQRPVLVYVVVPLLLLLVLELLLARRRLGVPKGQWRVGVAVRVAIAVLLLLALADVAIVRPADRVATMFLIDASDSVGPTGRADAVSFVQQAMEAQPDGAVSGVALFGGDARLELTVAEQNRLGKPAVKIDSTRTDIATAVRLAAAVLPSDARRRVVVVSDGRATQGDELEEAVRAGDAGVQVDVHTVGRVHGADLAISALDGPQLVRTGDRVDLQATIMATVAGPAVLTLDRDGKAVDERTVDLQVGENTVTFTDPAPPADVGLARYRLRLSSTTDTVAENDVGYAAVRIEGPAKILVAEGVDGNASTLVDALRSSGLEVDVIPASKLPALDELSLYQEVVLSDVDVKDLSNEQVATLAGSTRDLGHGLLTLGGDRSYGLGGYKDSELEQLLPVISDITDPKRRQTVAQILAIDTSGSMGACHCGNGNVNGVVDGRNQGGVSKTDISRAGAARAIAALSKDDQVGLLSLNTSDQWVMDLQPVPDEDGVRAALDQLHPSGGTDLRTSLRTSAEQLRASKASLKHIVLFTDGFTSMDVLKQLESDAAGLANDGITVSVLATGEGSSKELENVAKAGRGRYYPGEDLSRIPQIMQNEVVLASRSFVNEGEWLPEVTATSDLVRDLKASPALLGYIATTAKPTATTALRIGDERDPLLATWQIGLGRATSWTSDSALRWSKRWASWDGYVAFWTGVVKATLPAGEDSGSVRARVHDGKLEVRVEGTGAFPDGSKATARVTGPDLQGQEVQLDRLNDTTFAGEVPVSAPGSYAVGAVATGPEGTVLSASTLATQSYSAEYAPGEPDAAALARLSEVSHGRGEIEPTMAFDVGSLAAGVSRVPLAGWLLLLAALAWPMAVALSRLSLSRAARPHTIRRTASRLRLPPHPGKEPKPPPREDRDAVAQARLDERREAEAAATRAAAPPATLDRLLARKRSTEDDDAP